MYLSTSTRSRCCARSSGKSPLLTAIVPRCPSGRTLPSCNPLFRPDLRDVQASNALARVSSRTPLTLIARDSSRSMRVVRYNARRGASDRPAIRMEYQFEHVGFWGRLSDARVAQTASKVISHVRSRNARIIAPPSAAAIARELGDIEVVDEAELA